MVYYIIRRVLYAIPIALGVSIICFSLVYLGPGDPIQAVMPDEASEAETQRIRVAYGFDKPIPIQYLLWLSRAVQGDFGNSLQHNRPVIAELIPALQNTFRLAVFAATLSFLIAFVAGGIAAYRNGTWIDKSVTAFAITIILVIIFAVELGMLPAIGMGSGSSRDWAWDLDHMKALVMPVIALSMIPMGIIMRTTRASVLEVLSQDYVETLRSKGLSELNVLRHVIKNASPTVLAVTGLQFGHLLGGSILIETVFVWPGSGLLLNEAIFKRDVPILQGTVLVLAIFFVFVNLIVDIMQTWLDPRIKRG
ncbi:MAG: ABC transporter permease [Betaproteobacteria bacterium]|nr:ABC transporter permease [Betaproteobacteria bacterium]